MKIQLKNDKNQKSKYMESTFLWCEHCVHDCQVRSWFQIISHRICTGKACPQCESLFAIEFQTDKTSKKENMYIILMHKHCRVISYILVCIRRESVLEKIMLTSSPGRISPIALYYYM